VSVRRADGRRSDNAGSSLSLAQLVIREICRSSSRPAAPVFRYKIDPPEKSPTLPTISGKNPLRSAAAWAGRIFTGKLSAGGRLFWGGDPIMRKLFMGPAIF